jgi:hypothetical protein
MQEKGKSVKEHKIFPFVYSLSTHLNRSLNWIFLQILKLCPICLGGWKKLFIKKFSFCSNIIKNYLFSAVFYLISPDKLNSFSKPRQLSLGIVKSLQSFPMLCPTINIPPGKRYYLL